MNTKMDVIFGAYIGIEDGKINIDQEICVGCGICKTKCDKGIIKIKQTMPMRKDLHEYFLKDYNLDIKLWNKDNE